MDYYHNLVTRKSWQELQTLRKNVDSILIGGWAVYFYTKALKSKDIDIIVNYDQLPILEKNYALYKNDRLKKYEAVRDEVQIDIYLPFYSNLGIPIEDCLSETSTVAGFKLIKPHYLVALKIYALAQRARSPKGQKDFLDIISLVKEKMVDLTKVKELLDKYKLDQDCMLLQKILTETTELPELNLNKHYFSKLKKEISRDLIP